MTTQQAVILVGGRGTRLGALTDDLPKPLLAVGGRPFLGYVLDNLTRSGFKDIILLAGYQATAVVEFVNTCSYADVQIRCFIEDTPLGTGGALRQCQSILADEFLVLNGDTLFDINFNDLLTPKLCHGFARLALRRVEDTQRYGRVLLAHDIVHGMQEKGVVGNGLINGGIYCISRAALDDLPDGVSSLENDLFPKLISKGKLEGREYAGFFLDIGIPSDFTLAQQSVPAHQRRTAVFLDRDGVLNVDNHYVSRPEQFQWVDGAKAAVKRLNDEGYLVFVVTNQAGIARGYYSVADMTALHDWIQQELRACGAHIDAFYHCPHHPDLTGPCGCRKPQPGMILQAFQDWPVDQSRSVLIGDKSWDIEAAQQAGIKGFLFPGGNLEEFIANSLSK